MHREKARRELLKNDTSYIGQILEKLPKRMQLYSHLSPISRIIQIRRDMRYTAGEPQTNS